MKYPTESIVKKRISVAPLAGAWIEILPTCPARNGLLTSLPSRERGLKFLSPESNIYLSLVAPLAGAWIEIKIKISYKSVLRVAPLAGAWIEIEIYLDIKL